MNWPQSYKNAAHIQSPHPLVIPTMAPVSDTAAGEADDWEAEAEKEGRACYWLSQEM